MGKDRKFYVTDSNVRRKRIQRVAAGIGKRPKIDKGIEVQYSSMLQLYELWKKYIKDAIAASGTEAVARGDFHGCLFYVTRRGAPDVAGIVYQETKFTFAVVTKENRIVVVPKAGSMFRFVLAGKVYTVCGDNFRLSPVGRISRKIKMNNVVPELI